jgi:hypothetical protein
MSATSNRNGATVLTRGMPRDRGTEPPIAIGENTARLLWAIFLLAIGVILWSRAIGLPGDAPDIGNWLCTLGLAALFTETALIMLSATRLVVERRRATCREATTGIEPV